MTDNYMYPNINLERATAVKSFIFDPNATSDEDGTVFSDWQSMLGNISSIPGIKEIIIPGTVGSTIPTVIPPGNYDMTDIVLVGDNAFSAIEINDAVFENLQSISQLSVFVGQTAANSVPSFQISGGSAYVLTLDRVILAVSPPCHGAYVQSFRRVRRIDFPRALNVCFRRDPGIRCARYFRGNAQPDRGRICREQLRRRPWGASVLLCGARRIFQH